MILSDFLCFLNDKTMLISTTIIINFLFSLNSSCYLEGSVAWYMNIDSSISPNQLNLYYYLLPSFFFNNFCSDVCGLVFYSCYRDVLYTKTSVLLQMWNLPQIKMSVVLISFEGSVLSLYDAFTCMVLPNISVIAKNFLCFNDNSHVALELNQIASF